MNKDSTILTLFSLILLAFATWSSARIIENTTNSAVTREKTSSIRSHVIEIYKDVREIRDILRSQ